MKLAIGLATAWSAAFLLILVLYGARFGPCPELSPVGIADADRAAILQMCAARDRASADVLRANEPWSWLLIWGAGIGAVAVMTARRSPGSDVRR